MFITYSQASVDKCDNDTIYSEILIKAEKLVKIENTTFKNHKTIAYTVR